MQVYKQVSYYDRQIKQQLEMRRLDIELDLLNLSI